MQSPPYRECGVRLSNSSEDGDDAGAQAITELKTQYLGCPPVLFASIRDDIGARLAAYRAGASAYLTKPIDAGKLPGIHIYR